MMLCLTGVTASAQFEVQPSGTTARLRGLSVVSEKVAWASGTGGTYVRTTDGKTWVARTVPNAEGLDFRDVQAFDAKNAVLLAIGPGDKSRIYRTFDGGETWSLSYQEADPKAFLDAIAFWDRQHGIALGDPVGGKFLILTTSDGGVSWSKDSDAGMPLALTNEGAFAASGTCLVTSGRATVCFGTGGAKTARIFRSDDLGKTWKTHDTRMMAGKPTMGIFSLAMFDDQKGVAVGGAYDQADLIGGVAAWTEDGWKTSHIVTNDQPRGFRSAVVVVKNPDASILVAVGTSGSDISLDQGRSWKPFGNIGLHAVDFASMAHGWGVGDEGHIVHFP